MIIEVIIESNVFNKLRTIRLKQNNGTYGNEEGVYEGCDGILQMLEKSPGQLRITVVKEGGAFETIQKCDNLIVWIGKDGAHMMSISDSAIKVIKYGVFGGEQNDNRI
jgi:hypothetical protein